MPDTTSDSTMAETAADVGLILGKGKEKDNAVHIPANVPENYDRDAHDGRGHLEADGKNGLWREKPADDFHWVRSDEPHVVRRREILKKHPEILKLYGPDPISALFCFTTVTIQFVMAWVVSDWSWLPLILITWAISGTLNHSHVLAMHELSHDLWFPKKWQNILMGYVANLPCGVASAATFKRYHLEHHSSQGSDKWDADLPTDFEGRFFTTPFRKTVWVFMQWAFYGIRPLLVKPKAISIPEIINWVVIGTADYLVIKHLGAKAFFYLFGGQLLGLGLHPMSGHFIAEHFEFIEGQETYSYYGPLNYLAYNVGYHNEHHDFPKIPGRKLPQVRAIAPEFYDTLPYYDSWTKVITGFIFGKNINCFCRIKRD